MTKVRWREQKDKEWVRWPLARRKAIACCDCGLVHWFTTRVTKTGRVMFFAERDESQSAKFRKSNRPPLAPRKSKP